MREKIKNYFFSLFTMDMGRQARQVELLTLLVFILLLVVAGWLWQYKLELTAIQEGNKVVIAKMNIFQLLLSKK